MAAMFFWTLLVGWILHNLVLKAPIVVGSSMAPTLSAGQRTILWLLPYRLRDPARGDIVAIHLPWEESIIVKRVVALPNESVQIRNLSVIVNNVPLEEPYLDADTPTPPGPLSGHRYRVGDGCYFVLGDNRAHSFDSRWFGAVERDWIIGTVR